MKNTCYQQGQKGIGLVEILVSMFIGLFIMAGVVQMFSTTSRNSVANTGKSRIQENIRYAFNRISADIAKTGNLGCLSATMNQRVAEQLGLGSDREAWIVQSLLANSNGQNELYDFDRIIGGSNEATSATEPAGNVALGTDTLAFRYFDHTNTILVDVNNIANTSLTVDTSDESFGTLQQYAIVGLSNCESASIFMITNDVQSGGGLIQHDDATTAPSGGLNAGQSNSTADNGFNLSTTSNTATYLYAGDTGAYRYYIGTGAGASGACNTTTAPENCSLFRQSNNRNQELVEGVHNMEVEYGWFDTATGNLTYSTATVIDAADNWNIVDRVRVTLSFNSIENAQLSNTSSGNVFDALITQDVSRTIYLPNNTWAL